jgi:hypothetical protein
MQLRRVGCWGFEKDGVVGDEIEILLKGCG